jgi:hypothetical protein
MREAKKLLRRMKTDCCWSIAGRDLDTMGVADIRGLLHATVGRQAPASADCDDGN